MASTRPLDARKAFDVFSTDLKASADTVKPDPYDAAPVSEERAARTTAWVEKVLGKPAAEGEEAEGPGTGCAMSNLVSEAETLAWANAGLGAVETYRVSQALRRLATSKADTLSRVRLWGKVLGTQKDYYVAEGEPNGDGEKEELAEGETEPEEAFASEGANDRVYYVISDPADEWTRLPDARAGMIVDSRQVQRLCTGELSSAVVTEPHFDGKEMDLLRAQIAQISSDTVLTGKGMKILAEDDPSSVVDGETRPSPEAAAGSTSEWVHVHRKILSTGKTTHPEAEEDEDAAKKEAREALIARDPVRPLLRDADADAWALLMVHGADGRSVAVARSLQWPGAVAVLRGKEVVNFYAGYALPWRHAAMHPAAPPPMRASAPLPVEHEDPVPGEHPAEPPAQEEAEA